MSGRNMRVLQRRTGVQGDSNIRHFEKVFSVDLRWVDRP